MIVDSLSSFVVIKEHVVETQMVLRSSDLYKSSDFFNHHKDLTSSEIGDGTIFLFDRYSFAFIWNKKSIFVLVVHGCIKEGQHVSNEKAIPLDFCSIAAVNEVFANFFKEKS